MQVNVYGESFSRSIINQVGETKTYNGFYMSGSTYNNNGTVKVSKGFDLSTNSDFINNGELTATGNFPTNPFETFGISGGCSLKNTGTMRLSGYYNFGIYGTFENTGKLFLSNIENVSCSGLNNTGMIVYADDMAYDIVQN